MHIPPKSEQRYSKLNEAGKLLARKPRYARLIARLPIERVGELSTGASTYWEIYSYVAESRKDETGMIDDGLKSKGANKFGWHSQLKFDRTDREVRQWQVRLAMMFLGALAFEMMWPTKEVDETTSERPKDHKSDETKPRIFVESEEIDDFLNYVYDRIEASGEYRTKRGKDIDSEALPIDWGRLKRMDSHGLKCIFFRDTGHTRIEFADPTIRDFLAAYWASNFADPSSDFDQIWSCVPDPLKDSNDAFREFWLFIAEIPDRALIHKGNKWQALLSPIFDTSLSPNMRDLNDLPIRSSELIYRVWDRMEGSTAKVKFCAEFRSIQADESDARSYQIAERILSCFQVLGNSRTDRDNGRFVMGIGIDDDVKPRRVQLPRFQICSHCVKNDELELYDPRRRSLQGTIHGSTKSSQDVAFGVTWFDSWCFAKWIGSISDCGREYAVSLPSSAQWEYSARAGQEYMRASDEIRDGSCYYDKALAGAVAHNFDELPLNDFGIQILPTFYGEWCSDETPPHPTRSTKHRFKIVRGISFLGTLHMYRISIHEVPSVQRFPQVGFRLVANQNLND